MSDLSIIWRYVTHEIMRISSLDEVEFVKIVATYNNAGNERTSELELLERGYTREQLEQVRLSKKRQRVGIKSCGLYFTRDLSEFNCEKFNYYFLLFQNYERGNLPFEGTIADQPAQIIEIFNTFQMLRAEQEDKARKQLERQSKRGRR